MKIYIVSYDTRVLDEDRVVVGAWKDEGIANIFASLEAKDNPDRYYSVDSFELNEEST